MSLCPVCRRPERAHPAPLDCPAWGLARIGPNPGRLRRPPSRLEVAEARREAIAAGTPDLSAARSLKEAALLVAEEHGVSESVGRNDLKKMGWEPPPQG